MTPPFTSGRKDLLVLLQVARTGDNRRRIRGEKESERESECGREEERERRETDREREREQRGCGETSGESVSKERVRGTCVQQDNMCGFVLLAPLAPSTRECASRF